MVRFSLSLIIYLFFDKESTGDNAVQYKQKNQIRSTDDEPLDSYAITFVRNERTIIYESNAIVVDCWR